MSLVRLHPDFRLTRIITGRLAVAGYPILGLPKRSEEGRRIRGAVKAPPGFVIMELDYSQIELRTVAHMSQDPVMMEVYRRGEDIHAKTAHEVLGAPKDKAQQDEQKHRLPAKTANFSMLMGTTYGGLTSSIHKAGNLAWSAHCPGCKSWKAPHEDCDSQQFMDRWFTVYAGVRAFMDDRRAHALKTGRAYGMWGADWYLPGVWSPHEEVREATLRQTHALPVSEGAQRLLKLAMAAIEQYIVRNDLDAEVQPILQFHDSLLFVVHEDIAQSWHKVAKGLMENIVTWSIPIVAEGKCGPSWLNQHGLP